MAITPSDFSKIWASNADTPEYTFSEADYLKGWDFVGNLPPTRAQWNAMQKSTDEKMKYVFDNFGAPLTASTVAGMTMQNRVYVYTGSETGYTAGHWYYWDGTAWTDGGVYNSNTVQVDPTLTISGAAADSKVVGDIVRMIGRQFVLTETPGYFTSSGAIAQQSATTLEVYTDKHRVYPGERIVCRQKLSATQTLWCCYCAFDENDTIVGTRVIIFNGSSNEFSTEITVPENAYKIAFSYRTYGQSNSFSAISGYDVTSLLKTNFFDTSDSEHLVYSRTFATQNNLVTMALLKGYYKIDATGVDTSKTVAANFINETVSVCGSTFIQGGEVGYFYCSENTEKIQFYIIPGGGTIEVYRIDEPVLYENLVRTRQRALHGNVEIPDVIQGVYSRSGIDYSATRIITKAFDVVGSFTASITNTTDYKFSVVTLDAETGTKILFDPGWQTSSYTFSVDNSCTFGLIFSRVDNGTITPADISNIGVSVTSNQYWEKIATKKDVENTKLDISDTANDAVLAYSPFRFKPCFDHLFVNRTTNAVIPHESLYHVRLSHALGYDVIEANIHATSDGVYVVNHLANGTFGNYFHHVDGVTDISNIRLADVTWQWVVDNVRYNSTIPKYRTRPSRLEEFLGECKQNHLIPLAQIGNNAEIVSIVESYMGKNNYIAYNATREICPSAIIYQWKDFATKQEIIDYCESIGRPLIYGMANPTAFTEAELIEIVDELHQRGYWIGTSYVDYKWYYYSSIGFDTNSAQSSINRIQVGNIANVYTLQGFSNFIYTNATETDAGLTFNSDGVFRLDMDASQTIPVSMVDIEIWFEGTITVPSFGEGGGGTITSDGTKPYFITTVVLNMHPRPTLSASAGTIIHDIIYKISEIK